jgi:uncharacterized membrane protein YqiK
MSLIQKIQKKPQKTKNQIIVVIIILVVILMLVLWIFTSRIGKIEKPDTTLFKTMSKGFKDIKENFKK